MDDEAKEQEEEFDFPGEIIKNGKKGKGGSILPPDDDLPEDELDPAVEEPIDPDLAEEPEEESLDKMIEEELDEGDEPYDDVSDW